MDKEQVLKLIEKQKENLQKSELKCYKNRILLLKKLKNNIISMQNEIVEALKLDLGKSETESYMCEIGMVLSEITYMTKHIKRFSKPHRVRTPLSQFPAKSYSLPCAYGQVLIISPWNYPFLLSVQPLVDAISAGNSIVLKPSETSKHTQKVLEKLINATFKKTEVICVMGGRNECDFLLDLNWDYIFFTGSTRVGSIVLDKASKHFTPVTLEMGGKSPCIVDETANIKLAARRIIFGKLLNAGQTCVAPDYVYCHESIKEELASELKNQIMMQYTADPLQNPHYPKLINEKQFDAVTSLIQRENCIFGGNFDKNKLKIEPTLQNATFDDACMQTEIFGPLLPIVIFKSQKEAIAKINSMPKPLAFYVFSSSKENQDAFINSCDFGGGCINDTIIHLATSRLGFGGIKESGIGSYHGKFGFETFSHRKSIVNKKQWLDLSVRYQPHTKSDKKMIKSLLK